MEGFFAKIYIGISKTKLTHINLYYGSENRISTGNDSNGYLGKKIER